MTAVDFIVFASRLFADTYMLTLCVVGLVAMFRFDGPGVFELIGMLWRGEIRRRQ